MALSTNYDSATTYHSGFVKETLPSMNYNVNSADMQTVLMDADLFFYRFYRRVYRTSLINARRYYECFCDFVNKNRLCRNQEQVA